ncbi:DUF4157 domain-containing protein [Actinoplanes sp. NPDC051851]|uniref:eCIS core domain-containing protein n=1 Tax=Actinoplanes sp. NPDC051851 TaxID=3154753 RepID=UPI00342DA6CC
MGSSRRPDGDQHAATGRTAARGETARPGAGGWDLPTLQRAIGNRAFGELLAARSHSAGCGDGCGHDGGAANGLIDTALRGSGRPLEAPFQREMESTFRSDLSGVREFRGPAAERAAAAVDAKAFTIGSNIVYGAGGESKETRIHELTHVVKPISAVGSTVGGVGVTDPGGAGEREAEANARRIAAGGASTVTGAGALDDDQPVARATTGSVIQRALPAGAENSNVGFHRHLGAGGRVDDAWMVTDGSLQGYAPRQAPPGWDYIQNLGMTNFWIRFHLVNEIAGGPGSADNLVPASKIDNSQYHNRYENALKRDVAAAKPVVGDKVFYGVELDYQTPVTGTPGQQTNAPFFPTALQVYHGYYQAATQQWTQRHNGTLFPFSQAQPTDPGTVTALSSVDLSILKALAPGTQKWTQEDVDFLHDIATPNGTRNAEFTAYLNEVVAEKEPMYAYRYAFDKMPFKPKTAAGVSASGRPQRSTQGITFGTRIDGYTNGDVAMAQLCQHLGTGRITL